MKEWTSFDVEQYARDFKPAAAGCGCRRGTAPASGRPPARHAGHADARRHQRQRRHLRRLDHGPGRSRRRRPSGQIAKGRIATVAVNQFVFKQPVSMGDLLSFYAKVERIGRTSITVNVEVFAERNPADLRVVKVTGANLT